VQVRRLTGDREVGLQAVAQERVGRAVVDVLGLLVSHAEEQDAHGVLGAGVLYREHHRRQRALHVIGAAAVQPVALHARRELSVERRHDIEMPVQDDGRAVFRAGARHDHGQPVVIAVDDVDIARFQPALDEPGGGPQLVRLGRVVGHQALGQNAFVHPGSLRPHAVGGRHAGAPDRPRTRRRGPTSVRRCLPRLSRCRCR